MATSDEIPTPSGARSGSPVDGMVLGTGGCVCWTPVATGVPVGLTVGTAAAVGTTAVGTASAVDTASSVGAASARGATLVVSVAVAAAGGKVAAAVEVAAATDVAVADGAAVANGAAPHSAVEIVLVSRVTAPFRANALPGSIFALFCRAILVRARMLPLNEVVVPRVAELPTCQKTLQPEPPLIMETDEPAAVMRVLTVLKM